MSAENLGLSITNNVLSMPDIINEPKEGIGQAFFKQMKTHKDKIAQLEAETGNQDTFSELLTKSIRISLHLLDRNIKRGDVITVCSSNHLNVAPVLVASQFIGCIFGSVDPSFPQEELKHLLNVLQSKIVFATAESVPNVERAVRDIKLDAEIVVFGEKFSPFLESHQQEAEFEPVHITNLKETAFIHFSSGTSGLPKAICLSHFALLGQALNNDQCEHPDYEYLKSVAKRIRSPLMSLSYTSVYWLSGTTSILTSIISGYCRLLCGKFDGKQVWHFIEKYKPGVILLTPVQIIQMLQNSDQGKGLDTSHVLTVMPIGSALPNKYKTHLKSLFPHSEIHGAYGQTEVCGAVTVFKRHDKVQRALMAKEEKFESVGCPMRGNSYKVVDPETEQTLAANQQGELRLKSAFQMNGYYNQDSSDTFDKDGWLKTGDIVYYDEDYCFYVVDRIKEAFKYQGWFIVPSVIENELIKHPAVKLAVVIGVPRDDGHHPMGLVELNDGFEVSGKELEEFVQERVPERSRLRAGVRIVQSIPLSVNGKWKRRELKQMVLEEKL